MNISLFFFLQFHVMSVDITMAKQNYGHPRRISAGHAAVKNNAE